MSSLPRILRTTVLIITVCATAKAQNIDSLLSVLKAARHDTTRCILLGALVESEADPAIWPRYNEQMLSTAEKNLLKKSLPAREIFLYKKYYSDALTNIGFIYDNEGNMPKALEYYSKSVKIKEEISDKTGLASTLNNLAFVYNNQGDIPRALGVFDKSLKILEQMGDQERVSQSLNNIAFLYENQNEVEKALEYYNRSLRIKEETGDKAGAAVSLNNIGALYKEQHDIEKALEYHNRSLRIRQEINDRQGIGTSLNNIAAIYDYKKKFDQALDYYIRALKLLEESGNKEGIAHSLGNIADVYLKQKKYAQSIEAGRKALQISREIGYPENISHAAQILYAVYKATGDKKSALENYELYIRMRDSIRNENTRRASIRSQLRYEYEKKATADSVEHAKDTEVKNALLEKKNAEIAARKNQQYALFGGLALALGFTVIIYNRFRITRRQKLIIEQQKQLVEEQKKLVEEKQKEVLDSIHYAQRIQKAHLPSEKYLARVFGKMKN